MKISRVLLTALFIAGSSATALAAATPENAQRLTTVLQSYLGAEAGVVTVTPAGDSYALTIDATPLIGKVRETGFSASLSPIEMTLTDQGGGKWKIEQDQALSFSFKIEGATQLTGTAASLKGTGIFDEALGGFASSSSDVSGLTYDQTATEKGLTTKLTYGVDRLHYETQSSPSADGVDSSGLMTMTGLRETASVPASPDGSTPAMDFTITVPEGNQDFTMKGFRPRPLLDLLAWGIAHASPEAAKSAQPELKDKLRAILPLFGSFTSNSTFKRAAIATMLGEFRIDEIGATVEANGVVADGRFREAFAVKGLAMPPGIVPPFADGLVPHDFSLDFNLSGFDLAAPAKLLIDNFDFTRNSSLAPEVQQQLLQALLPKGYVTIVLAPSDIAARVFHLKAEGSMTAGPVATPAGQATIGLTGLDAIMTALQSAPPEMGLQQAAPMFLVAKGMAQSAADGSLTWKIESTPGGSVLVNGVDLSKMGGQ